MPSPLEWSRRSRKNRQIVAVLLVFVLVIAVNFLYVSWVPGIAIPIRSGTFRPNRSHDATGKRGAIASDVPLCSKMGVSVLRKGGNAADAAVTVALCIGSINFHSSGLGGGAFITVRDVEGKGLVIDSRETAPAAASKHMFDGAWDRAKYGGLASGVPGELRGLETMFKLYGSGNVTWHDLVEPVAALNRKGFECSEPIVDILKIAKRLPKHLIDLSMLNNPGWEWFLPNGLDGEVAPVIKRVRYAETLSLIARSGANAFYDPYGFIAPFLAETAQLSGGIITAQDIARYKVRLRKPLNATFMGREVITPPAPSSGPALIMGLKVIEKLLENDNRDLGSIETQRLIETMKWMAAARSQLGDPAFVDNPKIEEITGDEWVKNVISNISDSHTLPSWRDYHPAYEMNEPHGTASFSVVDANGMAVAMTTTVNLLFGNMVCDPMTGIVLNSEMDDFSVPDRQNYFELAPSEYNFIKPRKRPLSSMVPTIVVGENGLPETIIGAAGGSRILTAVFQALVRKYGYNLDMLQCIAFPRLHHQLIPEIAFAEYGIYDHTLLSLQEKGHKTEVEIAKSAMNGIFRDESGTFHAVSDYWRKYGQAAAY